MSCSPSLHTFRKSLEHHDSGVPINTGVCDAHTVREVPGVIEVLAAGVDVGFDHNANDVGKVWEVCALRVKGNVRSRTVEESGVNATHNF